MNEAVLADAGPLYAVVDPDDSHHRRAVREMERLDEERREIVVAYSTLLETYSLILFRLGKTTATDWLIDIADASLINPSPEDYRLAAAKLQGLADQPITLFDAVAAAMATRLRLQVWTYDHHFDVMRVPVWR
ncbi:MAG: PIN domain-containing protein [Candidatus Sulfotelmatobacter sp.]